MAPDESNLGHCLQGERLAASFDADGKLWLTELSDRLTGQSLLAAKARFCVIEVDGVEGHIGSTETSPTEGLVFNWSTLSDSIRARVEIQLDGASFRWRLELAGQGERCRIRFPFLEALRVGDDPEYPDRVLMGERSFRDGEGRQIFRNADWPLPMVRIGPDGCTITVFVMHCPEPESFDPEMLWSVSGLIIELTPEMETVFEAELILHEGGWPAAFGLFRERIRARFDLSEYQRSDTSWYRDQIVQHFTFLYGREILNLETGQFEIDRFLDEAERDFGGYDGFLIWAHFPQMGIDERTQWDIYDDLPGGREGLRAMGRRARERGVRFFIPYKPWDRSADLHGRSPGPDHELLAKVVKDVEADGVFLDTMREIGGEFRAAIDGVRPGVVFCSEGRAKGLAFEVVAGSWDQSSGEQTMPGADLWRFVFPEHPLFVISRMSVGADRICIIQRGFFSGMGWVVWQDIFGLVLTYSPEEAALLKKCRTIFREHRQALHSPSPTPLVQTLIPGVYANEFSGDTKRLWTLYNENDHWVDDAVFEVQPRRGYHFVDVWNNKDVQIDANGHLRLSMGPRSVGAVVELPRILDFSQADQKVTVVEPAPGSVIQIRQTGGEYSESINDVSFDLARMQESVEGPCLVRLLLDREVLDQIVIHI